MDNLRGALLMILSMAGFAIEDTFIVLLSERLSVGQILLTAGVLGASLFGILMRLRNDRFWTRTLLRPGVIARNITELSAGVLFVSALAMGDLSTMAVILQAAPLLIVMGAALFLGEHVGIHRWTAIAIGFLGMLLVVRPGTAQFESAVLLAVGGVILMTARDLITRRLDPSISSMQLSTAAFAVYVPTGLLLLWLSDSVLLMPTAREWGFLFAMAISGVCAYMAIVGATRIGEISAIVPFRYSRLLFALLIATLFLGERPDALTLLGAAILVASGLYAFYREHRARARVTAPQPSDLT